MRSPLQVLREAVNRSFAARYDAFMAETEEACLRAWRAEVLADLSGEVVDLGAGTGANLALFPASVRKIYAVEPDPFMRERLVARVRAEGLARVEVLDAPGERLPFGDASLDGAASALVLCSVADPSQALGELRRVLRPGGALAFVEHVAAERGTRRHLIQRLLEPFWRRMAGNCHLTRTTAATIEEAGFEIRSLERASMRKALPFVRPSVRGVAHRPR